MKRRSHWLSLGLPILLSAILAPFARTALAEDPAVRQQLHAIFDDAWEFDLNEDPLAATAAGDRRGNARLPAMTLADHERRNVANREFLERLATIDRDSLNPRDRISFDLFLRMRQDAAAEFDFGSHLIPITNRSGFHISFPDLPKETPLVTVEDYENYIARLNAFAGYARQHIDLLRAGMQVEWVLPAVVLAGFEKPLASQIVDDPRQSLLYAPFADFPAAISADARERLEAAGRQAIADSVVPGYREFLEFMSNEYVPRARGSVGASGMPNGREFYRHRVRHFTTLDLTPEQVHETGLAEVARIRDEMDSVVRKANFAGDRRAYVEHLRTDSKYYAATPDDLMKEVGYVMKRMDGQLPRLFRTLPRMPYGIREIPAFIAPFTTTAYYSPPAGDGTRAGFYYVNVHDLKSRPLYEIEALSLHEAVPGHHLQIALQQELTDLPKFQRFATINAFVEGWALYAERLGLETGFYQTPASDFGRLSYEMWRACRLVVDTGLHYLGWTREQAIEYMVENTALTRLNIVNEVDRYIAWPGQALGYKIGELKIRELRALAERELKEKFDVREFHDVVLQNGGIPLDVLERVVRDYIDATRQ